METPAKVPRLQRFVALLKIGYIELRYWFIGMTPEEYHFAQSRHYEQLGAPDRSAHHAREVLSYAEYPEPRVRLGYYCTMHGRTAEAAEHYRKATETWPHPAVLLALAQAELRLGRHHVAAELLSRAENSEMKDQLLGPISEVRSELAAASNALQSDAAKTARI